MDQTTGWSRIGAAFRAGRGKISCRWHSGFTLKNGKKEGDCPCRRCYFFSVWSRRSDDGRRSLKSANSVKVGVAAFLNCGVEVVRSWAGRGAPEIAQPPPKTAL